MCLEVVAKDGRGLRWASPRLRADPEVVARAIANNVHTAVAALPEALSHPMVQTIIREKTEQSRAHALSEVF